MTDDLHLAPPRAEDRAGWAALWRAYLASYGATRNEATFDAAFGQITSSDPQAFRARLAWRGGTMVGLVHWVWHPHMWRPEGIHYLQDLYVADSARGTGAGRCLIEAVFEAADDAGAAGVYWLTRTDNARARLLYDRVGLPSDFMRYDRPAPDARG